MRNSKKTYKRRDQGNSIVRQKSNDNTMPVIKSWQHMQELFPDKNFLEKKLSSKTLFQSPYLHLQKHLIRDSAGQKSDRVIVRHPGSVMVVPVFENNCFVMVKQFRYSHQKVCVEFPAGKIDPGEGLLSTAKRELQEETGFTAAHMKKLISVVPSLGYSTEVMTIFKATGLKYKNRIYVQDEILSSFIVKASTLEKWIHQGLIEDPKTILAFYLLKK